MIEDILLPEAVDYYRHHVDEEKELLGYRLKVKFLKWRKQIDAAVAVLDSALEVARMKQDPSCLVNLLSDKAELYYDFRRDYAGASRLIKQSLEYGTDTLSREYCKKNYFMAINQSLSGADSSNYYYKKSIALAEANKDTFYLCHYLRNYASYLTSLGEEREAIGLIQRIWHFFPEYRLSNMQLVAAEGFLRLR